MVQAIGLSDGMRRRVQSWTRWIAESTETNWLGQTPASALLLRALRRNLVIRVAFGGVDNPEHLLAASVLIDAGDGILRRHSCAERIQGRVNRLLAYLAWSSLLVGFYSSHFT